MFFDVGVVHEFKEFQIGHHEESGCEFRCIDVITHYNQLVKVG